ncbi:MAG TPA: thermopsin family protease [Nitrososphaerales archaeon]|nr:thermopsin family protease [Nitrososphaerales archaeon]
MVVGLLLLGGTVYVFLTNFNLQCPFGVTAGGDSQSQPVDIYCGYYRPPVPTGISDYGVINSSGTWSAYRVDATQIVGEAWIYSIGVNDPSLSQMRNVAGLQLNVVLKVSTTHGDQSYWVQNIAFFDTTEDYVNFANQIWNFSGPEAWMHSADVSGNGDVSGNPPEAAYSMDRNLPGAHYALPMHFEIITNVLRDANGVVIGFAYNGFLNSFPILGTTWDEVHIAATGVLGAAFEVNGFQTTGRAYYNAEFVFTGPPGSSAIAYRTLNATIGLRYVLTNGTVTSPRSVFEFGTTGESVTNLQTKLVNGSFEVSVGQVDMNRDYLTGS